MYWILLLCVCVAQAQRTSVDTSQGTIVGYLEDEGHIAFHGIPYAGSTSGENRFKAPTPAPRFPREFFAIDSNIVCAHPTSTGFHGTEDCLTLSIFTKNVTTPKPVLVWVQGEDFQTWQAAPYSYRKIVQSDLVLVKLNYRLSIFGFLCLGVADAPGNAGLRDILQGLKWIQDNIAAFGGDPNNVVLLGHGSGAAMVDLITLSPLATGLVHKAIALSGSGLAPWAVAYDPVGHANAVGNKLGYNVQNRRQLAKRLAATDLTALGTVLFDFEFLNNTVLFGPCVENVELNPDNTVLADAPINVLRSGNYSDIPYIGGHTNREGTIRAEQAAFGDWLYRMRINFSDFIQVDLNFESQANKADIVKSIQDFYFSAPTTNTQEIESFLEYIGNTTISVAMIRNVMERSSKPNSQVRFFEFAYPGIQPIWPLPQIPLNGAKHGAILDYLFGSDLKLSDIDAQKFLIQQFTHFAYTGIPYNSSFWLPVPSSIYIHGGEVTNEHSGVFAMKEEKLNYKPGINFWNDLYERYYVPPKAVSSAGQLLSAISLLLLSQVIHKLY